MTTCYDPGALRAYLDRELPEDELDAVARHLDGCAPCAEQTSDLLALDTHTHDLLRDGGSVPDVDAALRRFHDRVGPTPLRTGHRPRRFVRARGRRSAIAAAVAAALALSLLVPGIRAAADSLLQVFRADKVVYITVSPQRVQQLENLSGDQNTLFLSPPTQVGSQTAPQDVSSVAQASALTGFPVQAPTTFVTAPTATTYTVLPRTAYQFQVNVQSLRQILAAFNVTDVTIPDALGAQPISIVLPSAVRLQYQGNYYALSLIEGTTPTATLPSGVDLAQLGKAALEVLGMPADQADALSKRIDWRSTLIFPFPAGVSNIQQVSVDGVTGVMFTAGSRNGTENVLYWQKGDHFYVLDGRGESIDTSTMLATANSIK
ncbi:MAG TPA: zf-HC2 domain-containing protein [Ktedonobacterales bacterium]|nr:zf-HC2 domain-containing protein [Ktedonobacterales bacterium]